MLAVLGCMVTLATALAFMLPAVSMTWEVAQQANGIHVVSGISSAVDRATGGANAIAGRSTAANVTAGGDSGHSAKAVAGGSRSDEAGGATGGEAAGISEGADASTSENTDNDNAADDASAGGADGNGADEDGAGTDELDGEADGEQTDGSSSSDETANAGDVHDGDEADETASGEAASASDEAASASDGAASTSASAAAVNPAKPAQTFKETLRNKNGTVTFVISVEAPEGALPAGTTMEVREVKAANLVDAIDEVVQSSDAGEIEQIKAVDITFKDAEGVAVEPKKDVTVTMSCDFVKPDANLLVVHVDDKGKADVVEQLTEKERKRRDLDLAENELAFDADKFSIYAIVGTVLEEKVLASDGKNYSITVTYDDEAGVPRGSRLKAYEVTGHYSEYDDYVSRAEGALGYEEGSASYVRLFDISIVDKEGEKVQVAAPVSVEIKLDDREGEDAGAKTQVVHFADDADEPDVVQNATIDGATVSFDADGFSVYAIIDAPEPVPSSGWNKIGSIEEIARLGASGLYVRHPSGFYFTNETYAINANRTGIKKVKPKATSPDETGGKAALYYFEQVEGSADQFLVYCLDTDGGRQYVRQTTNSLSFAAQEDATKFTISAFPGQDETFRLLGTGGYYWNMQGGDGGNGFAAYNSATDTNARIQLEYYAQQADDPYGMDGAVFGIAYQNESATASALTADAATVNKAQGLAALDMLMRPDVLDNEGILLVAQGSDIVEWTFHSVSEDKYYLTATVDGTTKYLTIRNNDVTLEDEPDADGASLITATPGRNANSGKWRFSVGGYYLTPILNNSANKVSGFYASSANLAESWLNLVGRSVLGDDDFNLYTAKKVSVSDDTNVYDGQQVIVYTRIWNDTTKRYEFYAVDHDGTLVRCYDAGDSIEWIGSKVNTALWEFTEYFNADGSASNYYELQNVQYHDYIAPQIADDQVLSRSTIGINLSGRRYGRSFTTIVAWDDAHYEYAGLKTQDGRVVSCPLSEAEDFYFAVVDPVDATDELTTVRTIDSGQFGITMQMVDFNNSLDSNNRDSAQAEFFGGDKGANGGDGSGLLSTDLGADGYPKRTAATGQSDEKSLGELFVSGGDGLKPVDNLFLESIYNESGYFEYNSTQNFAHLNEDGTFTVYDQLAAIGNVDSNTRAHGQFMPYNIIQAGKYSTTVNRTTVDQKELPDTDPRKGERLYLIGDKEADYFFGMQMSASFTQTASGLDAWGHDIIFEFSGDDDFWLYVDGELVLDLGGVHSAMTGSINFRTGEVKSTRGDSTLYDIFEKNYRERNAGATDAEVKAYLDEIFTTNDDGQLVFTDYSNHTMKMFYMERGAGASNLHMRFNLAAVQPGTFTLSKKLSGTENPANDLIEFPYQVFYFDEDDLEGMNPIPLGEKDEDGSYNVTYTGTSLPVSFCDSFTPAGGSVSYRNVFLLKPGQSAQVKLPNNAGSYYVVECGVNPGVYDEVKANGVKLAGEPSGNEGRADYATAKDTLVNRSEVEYDNHVREGAMRTLAITKRLYAENGMDVLHYPANPTAFNFRLYLGSENASADNLPLADMYEYHVKNAQKEYCIWNADEQRFYPLDKVDYAELTDAEKRAATFTTSMNGSISKIPADYTVEVRNLIVGTQFKVEERDYEIPKGYTLRLSDGYTRIDDGHEQVNGTTPISGTIAVDEDPAIEVRNQKGWGLTVEKTWTDKDFMEERDPVYFAIYLKDDQGELGDLLEGSVRQLTSDETSVYYFFNHLESGAAFTDYVVCEVVLDPGEDGLTIAEDGTVTGYETIARIGNGGDEGGTLDIGGTPLGGDRQGSGLVYAVSYNPGEMTDRNENVRTDEVVNSRPGIRLYKTDWDGNPLSGAVFTLKDQSGADVAAARYTSGLDGLITTAYLSEGTYLLTEVSAPKGYVVMDTSMVIVVGVGGSVKVSGVDGSFYKLDAAGADMAATITIRNRPAALLARKIDAATKEPIPSVHFALYHQVTDLDGNKRKDYQPMGGYGDVVTGDDGILPGINMQLGAGTYYLEETKAAEGYDKLSEDLCFTIGENGTVRIESEAYKNCLRMTKDDRTGDVSYAITIPNGKVKEVEVLKVSVGTSAVLEGAIFALYHAEDFDDANNAPNEDAEIVAQRATDEFGVLPLGPLPLGEYRLVETMAPEGYLLPDEPVKLYVSSAGVQAMQGNNQSNVAQSAEDGPWTVEVWNTAGVELPNTGGPGSGVFTCLGVVLIALAGAILCRRYVRI